MSVAMLDTRAILGMDAPLVHVEVHVANGLPALSIVGLPEASVKESKDRVRSALQSSGWQLPPKRITVSLAPADLPKTGGRYDLPIALGILQASGQLDGVGLDHYEAYGELALTGELRATNGAISSVLESKSNGKQLILPESNRAEIELILQTRPELATMILLVTDLRHACEVLLGKSEPVQVVSFVEQHLQPQYVVDIADVVGQLEAKRVLEIDASGDHSMMVGPPSSGKSMLSERLVTLLPNLSGDEAVEVAKVHSIRRQHTRTENFYHRPFIQPHHTASAAAIVGGTNPKPSALSLAHNGVLFPAELPEFDRNVLEALREPLETKQVHISRVNQHVTYPANHLLVAAMNPSPSGYFPDDPLRRCKDTPDQITRYQKKISGPLLDRIDLHLEVPAVEIKDLRRAADSQQEISEAVRQRVVQVRQRKWNRQRCFNSALSSKQLEQYCALDEVGERLIDKAENELGLSARGFDRVLKVARTIADMDFSKQILAPHLAEALRYRFMIKALS